MPESHFALQERLSEHLTHLVRDRNPYFSPSGHFYVQHYILEHLARWGTVETDDFFVGGKTHQNLILNLPSSSPKPPILIAAHYDTVPGTPGADDNATGVAVLLELARLLAAEPTRHPIRLVAFDLEEFGLQGSRHYATALKQQQQPLHLMLSLEMLGYCNSAPDSQSYPTPLLKSIYPHQGNFIALIGNLVSIPAMFHLRHHISKGGTPCHGLPVPRQGLILPDTRRSDHAPFWDAGYRAILITDTAQLRNPHYHKASDTLDTLDLNFLTQICHSLSIGVRCL